MDKAALTTYLHEHIPLSRAMQVTVDDLAVDRVGLRAPLAPNINHRDTVFGGSASALAILAAWSAIHLGLRHAGLRSRVVIQRNTMEYLLPIAGDFEARSHLDAESWARFVALLRRRGKSRLAQTARLYCAGVEVGVLHGEFVALGVDDGAA